MHERFDMSLRCGSEGVIEQHAGSEGFCVAIRLGVAPRSGKSVQDGAMHRMPIRLLGRGRSGTEHELAPSFARTSALRAVTPPFPTRETRLGTVEARPSSATN